VPKVELKRPGRPVDPELQSRRRAQILSAAGRFFARLGFFNTDVQVIADAIGVGKGTVYRYFRTKEELFLATAEDVLQRLEEHIAAAVHGLEHPLEIIRRVGKAYAEFFEQNPEAVELLIQERAAFRGSVPETRLMYREKNRGRFEAVLRRGIETGLFRPINVRETTDAFANLLYGTVVSSELKRGRRRLTDAIRHGLELLLKGILAEGSKHA
jgi:AcrR family transcriptional regulator